MTDLQMRRHKWFPTLDGVDVCAECSQPDFPEVGVFCPGRKPSAALKPNSRPPTATEGMVWHDNSSGKVLKRVNGEWFERPKPATTEPPVWKGLPSQAMLDLAEMERKAREEVSGITDLMRGGPPVYPELYHKALRRSVKVVAKGVPAQALEAFIARMVKKREVNPAPTSAEIIAGLNREKAEHATSKAFARAFASPLTFTARLGMKHP